MRGLPAPSRIAALALCSALGIGAPVRAQGFGVPADPAMLVAPVLLLLALPLAMDLAHKQQVKPPAPPPGEAPVPVPDNTSPRIVIGSRTLQLPPLAWQALPSTQSVVHGGQHRTLVARTDPVIVQTGRAVAVDRNGALAAAVEFTSNAQQAFGTIYWNADDGCGQEPAVLVDRFARSLDRPECLAVRSIAPAAAGRWQGALSALAVQPQRSWEIRYERYGYGWAIAASYLLPATFAGEADAIGWARALARELRPLASEQQPATAVTPVLPQP